MAEASRTEIFDAPIEKVYDVIVDYASYPDFVDGVSGVDVLEQSEEGARVEYSLNLIKKFKYILKLTHSRPHSVSWHFESGDIFKSNDGSWELKDLGDGRTEVKYTLEVSVGGFIKPPKSMIDNLTAKNLPSMMKAYHERAKSL